MEASPPAVPPDAALFIDFDGTLVELAEQPDQVRVPDGLRPLLERLRRRLDRALAVITGRRLDAIDALLAPLRLPGAGVHGVELRIDGELQQPVVEGLAGVAARLKARFGRDSGLLVEDKGAAVALHYRHAPRRASEAEHALREAVRDLRVDVVAGKFVFEARPRGVDKGKAVRELLRHAPFAGRLPLFVGDDVTDEDAITEVQMLGGIGIKVGAGPTAARYRLPDPQAVRGWLAASLQGMEDERGDKDAGSPVRQGSVRNTFRER
jgi:trehalose 6-phosphate phosphatase